MVLGALRRTTAALVGGALAAAGLATPIGAQDRPVPGRAAGLVGPAVNTYGVPGLIDMPSAEMQPDAELTTSLALMGNGIGRGQIGFQLTPRLQAVFRYASVPDFLALDGPGAPRSRLYDRSFDVRFQLLRERGWRPAVTVGLQDIGGTSIYSGEYVAATKRFARGRLAVTGGIGWGRLGSRGGFSNPLGALSDRFDDRPPVDAGEGGEFSTDQFFRGDAALFGGVAWAVNDRLLLKAEYSSDAYDTEDSLDIVDIGSPLNFGLDYQLRDGLRLGAYVLGGTEVGVTLQFALNPKRPPNGSGLEGAPLPVTARPSRAAAPQLWTEAWVGNPAVETPVIAGLSQAMSAQGLTLVSWNLAGDRAQIRFRNGTYRSQAQAIGRAARALSGTVPSSVETFILVPVNDDGVAGAAVVLARSDIEALETAPDGTEAILARAQILDAAALPDAPLRFGEAAYPRFDWRIGPSVSTTFFEPDQPLRLDLNLQAAGRWEPTPGLVFEGAVSRRIVGNRDERREPQESLLPRVRTNSAAFSETDGPFVPYLTGAYFFRPGPGLYGRVSAGLLESQYAGVSAEMLWKPVDRRLALGVEVNRVRQRDFDKRFGLRDLDATTAFVTGYLEHGGGFHSRLAVGQYLAGDVGATYELTREFANGWRVGAYATKTDVSAETFGEGSFDKGIRLTIPLDWVSGRPSRDSTSVLIQPVLRDGGARLNLRDRLYPLVRDQSPPVLTEEWGRFWR